MFSIGYMPPPDFKAIECPEIEWVRRQTEDPSLVMQRTVKGTWTISAKASNGLLFDIADCGEGPKPRVSDKLVASIRSMVPAAQCGKLAKELRKASNFRNKRVLDRMQEKVNQYAGFLARLGKTQSHPIFQKARQMAR